MDNTAQSTVERRWVRAEIDEPLAKSLSDSLDVGLRAAKLLVNRGISDVAEAQRYLDPKLEHIPDPFSMKGVVKASARLADAIERGEKITLYGDYDVDGVTSTALLCSFLGAHGIDAAIYIPKRLIEGYGLNAEAVKSIAEKGTQVLVTLDCGITAADEIERANEHGIDCIVVDHHRCPPELPPAYATLNPQQEDCDYPEPILAAVGVCFNLIIVLRKTLRDRGYYTNGEPNLRRYMDLVALGTICDMVPLTGVNRVLTWYGLLELRRAKRTGLRALMEISRAKPAQLTSSDVGFKLGPRINAAGRLDDATVGVRLMLCEEMKAARKLAKALDMANVNRRKIEAQVYRGAIAQIEAMKSLPEALVLVDETWHPGVVGIVASKLVDLYERPTILIGEGGRGSARTARGVHLYNAMASCAEYLNKFGGHRAAAGMRIAFSKVDAFREAFLKQVEEGIDDDYQPTLLYDDELRPEEIDDQCFNEIHRLEPFGNGNPMPLFKVGGMRVKNARVVGGEHLKLRFWEGRHGGLQAIFFKKGALKESLDQNTEVEVAGYVERNEFNGMYSLELKVRDLRTAEL